MDATTKPDNINAKEVQCIREARALVDKTLDVTAFKYGAITITPHSGPLYDLAIQLGASRFNDCMKRSLGK